MKRVILVTAVLLAAAATVSAEGLSPKFYASAGIGLPLKPDNLVPGIDIGLSDMYKSAANFGAGVGLQLSPSFELVGRINYSTFSFDEEGFSEKVTEEITGLVPIPGLVTLSTDITGADITVLEFMADVKLNVPVGGEGSTFKPFVLGGAGLASATLGEWTLDFSASIAGLWDTTITAAASKLSETKLVFNFGAGFDWMLSPQLGIFADARYAQVAVTGDPIGYLPIRVGLVFKPGQ